MVPAAFVALADDPVHDERQGRPPPPARARAAAPPSARSCRPRTSAETLVVEAFARALGRTDLGVNDDFFDLGGNSIKAVAVGRRARAPTSAITANDLFRLRTARDVAREIPMRRGDLHGAARRARRRASRATTAATRSSELAPELARYRRALPAVHRRCRSTSRWRIATSCSPARPASSAATCCATSCSRSDAKVHVAVRAAKRGEAWDRLAAKMARYFGPELLETPSRAASTSCSATSPSRSSASTAARSTRSRARSTASSTPPR